MCVCVYVCVCVISVSDSVQPWLTQNAHGINRVFTTGDTRCQKTPPFGSMLNLDADVKKTSSVRNR